MGVWTSCQRRTNSRSPEQERSKDSFLSLSRSLKCSPTTPASLSPLTRPSLDSRRFSLASTTTCPRSPSTWSATLTRSSPRPRGSQLSAETNCRSSLHFTEATPSSLELLDYVKHSHIWCTVNFKLVYV